MDFYTGAIVILPPFLSLISGLVDAIAIASIGFIIDFLTLLGVGKTLTICVILLQNQMAKIIWAIFVFGIGREDLVLSVLFGIEIMSVKEAYMNSFEFTEILTISIVGSILTPVLAFHIYNLFPRARCRFASRAIVRGFVHGAVMATTLIVLEWFCLLTAALSAVKIILMNFHLPIILLRTHLIKMKMMWMKFLIELEVEGAVMGLMIIIDITSASHALANGHTLSATLVVLLTGLVLTAAMTLCRTSMTSWLNTASTQNRTACEKEFFKVAFVIISAMIVTELFGMISYVLISSGIYTMLPFLIIGLQTQLTKVTWTLFLLEIGVNGTVRTWLIVGVEVLAAQRSLENGLTLAGTCIMLMLGLAITPVMICFLRRLQNDGWTVRYQALSEIMDTFTRQINIIFLMGKAVFREFRNDPRLIKAFFNRRVLAEAMVLLRRKYEQVLQELEVDKTPQESKTEIVDDKPSVAVGMIFDVSDSMEKYVTLDSDHSVRERWANSVFRVMEDLLNNCAFWSNEVFAFGAGAKSEPVVFDLLGTLFPKWVQTQADKNRHSETEDLLSKIEEKLDGADKNLVRTARQWLKRKADSLLRDDDHLKASEVVLKDAALLLAALELDDEVSSGIIGIISLRLFGSKPSWMKRRRPGKYLRFILQEVQDAEGSEADVNERRATKSELEERVNMHKHNLVTKMMQLLENNGAPSIRDWASDRVVATAMEFDDLLTTLSALEKDAEFLHKVVKECLPPKCRRSKNWDRNNLDVLVGNIFNGALQIIVSTSTITEEVRIARDKAKNSWNSLHQVPVRINPSSAVLPGKRALEILKGNVLRKGEDELTDDRVEELIQEIEPYIYGGARLIKALMEARRVFKQSKSKKRLLFVLSDGKPTDDDVAPALKRDELADKIRRDLEELDVHVVCCFITKDNIEGKRLYCMEDPDWKDDAKFMYNLSSTVSTQHLPRTVFVKTDWQIDFDNNRTRLFTQVNNPDMIRGVTAFIKDILYSQDSLSDVLVLGSLSLDLLIDRENDEYSAPDQEESPTCVANATASVFYLAMRRIYQRQVNAIPPCLSRLHFAKRTQTTVGYPYYLEKVGQSASRRNFFLLRSLIRELYSSMPERTRGTANLLDDITLKTDDSGCIVHDPGERNWFRLRHREVTLREAMEAIASKEPVLATFRLSSAGRQNFNDLKPPGIFTSEAAGTKPTSAEHGYGHAVVLTSYNGNNLKFMNSYGTDWGDGTGFFTVEDSDVLFFLRLYKVYWEEEDLTETEKKAFRESGQEVAHELFEKFEVLKDVRHPCLKCGKPSRVIEFQGDFMKVTCPKCGKSFGLDETASDLVLAMYLRSLSGEKASSKYSISFSSEK